jgi:fibronectin type 3 domain-containing protein
VTITNSGTGTLSWTASDNASWLTLSPASGTGSGSLTASINTAGLAAGSYSGTITIAASGATNTPQTVAVSLTVSAPSTSTATLTWNANTETDLASYNVYRSTTSGVYGAALANVPAGTVSYMATGLQTGTTYYFTITAVDSAGNESPHSTEVSRSIF